MRRLVYFAVLAAMLMPAVTASAESAGEKRVAQQIGSHLKQSGKLHNYRVGVKYHDGTAYLAGSVADQEQRDIAVRLAQQVEGVSHVVCKLEIENEGQTAAQNAESNDGGEDRQQLSSELDRASYEGAQNDAQSVMHAYGQGGEQQAAPIQQYQQNQMAQRQQMGRSYAPQARRGNMPVPAGRFGGTPMGPNPMMGQMGPGQNCPSGVCQAGCNTCNSGGGMGMGPGPGMGMGGMGGGAPAGFVPGGGPGGSPNYDNPQLPGYAWPSYASHPNYAAVSYPQQYSPTAWPYIGPFYPYPQVPLAWRKVSLEWDDGWWFLDFSAHNSSH